MKKILLSLVFLLCALFSVNAYAIESIDILTGYFHGYMDNTEKDYNAVPLLVGINYNLKPWIAKIGLNTQGSFNFVLEPFINTVVEPDSNVEVGSNFLLKYGFPLTEKLQPYVKAGVGALYMSQHTKEQSTQYNFLPQGGAGLQYRVTNDIAINLEYRYRHLSNAALKHPNSGIDVNMYLCGVTIFFNDTKSKDN
ncbi:MAG: acyloxyacyl hydrolase [Candidatus Omnitrophota bacterium]|jgi:hypothetical protein